MDAGELQGEERDAAGAEEEDGLSGVDLPSDDEGVPGGDGGAGERGGFGEGEGVGDTDEAGFREDAVGGEDAVDGTAEGGSAAVFGDLAGVPGLEEEAGDAVAALERGDVRADADDLARGVGAEDTGELHFGVVLPEDDHEVAEVTRGGVEADVDLARAGGGERIFVEVEIVEAEAVAEAEDGRGANGPWMRSSCLCCRETFARTGADGLG